MTRPPTTRHTPPTSPSEALGPFMRVQVHRGPSGIPPQHTVSAVVRDLVPWDDEARSAVAALLVFDLTAGKITVITSSPTGAGIEALVDAGDRYVLPETLIVFAVRTPTGSLVGPDADRRAAPGRPAFRPGPRDTEVLLAGRDRLDPLTYPRWHASHFDTQIVTERNAWTAHCQSACPHCPSNSGLYRSGPPCWIPRAAVGYSTTTIGTAGT